MWLVAGALLAALFAVLLWWNRGGDYQLSVALQPEFRVSSIDPQAGTMRIENAHEGFVVHCADTCGTFTIGSHYRMVYRGAVMEYRRNGKRFRFPILQQRVNFEVIGGRG